MVEVSSQIGLPPALVELIAEELGQGTTRSGSNESGVVGPDTGALSPHTAASVRRRQRTKITVAIAVLAVGRVLAALASTMLHNNVIGIVGACCSVASLLAVHLFVRRSR